MTKIKEHFKNIIIPYLPKGSEPEIQDERDFRLDVTGTVTSDQDRPNKPTKTITIIISRETLSDYLAASQSSQKTFDAKLIRYIKTQVASFSPDHNRPRSQGPPVEQWFVPFGMTY